jgi:hypothetical protein
VSSPGRTGWVIPAVFALATACEPEVRYPEVSPVTDDPASGDAALRGPNGQTCVAGSQCQSAYCVDGVCCAEPCDGVCETCDIDGTCGMAADDAACTVDCDGLDTTCRDYDDPSERCAARGQCKTSNSMDCTTYLDASNATPCDDDDAATAPDRCNGSGSCVGGQAVLAAVGTFSITTAPVGTVVGVTGVGFQPKILFLWWSGRTTDPATVTTAAGRQHFRRGFAMAAGPNACRMVTNQAEDGTQPADADRMYRADVCVSSINRSGSIDGMAELAAFDADGFSLAIVFDAFDEPLAITYLALGGAAITNAKVGTFTSLTGASSGPQEITDVGFQPDAVFFLSGYGTEVPPYLTSSACMSLGAATGPAVEQNALTVVAVPNGSSPPTSRGYGVVGESLGTGSSWLTMVERGRLGGFLPQGFQVDWIEADSDNAFVYFYLAVQGGSPRVGTLLSLLDTTSDAVVTGLGYRPAGALLVSRGEDEDSPDSSNSRDAWSVGAFASGPTEQWAQGAYHAALSEGDPMPDSRASTVLSAENVYLRLSDSGNVDAAMALISVEDDGFTCRMTNADSSRRRLIWFLSFGPGMP